MSTRWTTLFSLGLTLVACDGRPSRERFPGPQGRTTDIQQAQNERAVLGGVNSNVPVESHSGPGDGVRSAPAAGGRIKGSVTLGKGVRPAGTYLFLSVRPANGGPPLAARREMSAKFPYEFSLSAADVMIPGTPFEGEVVVTARIKQDADPLSRRKGDYSGMVLTKVGDEKLRIVIDKPEG